ncbi:hypothetical protein VE25_02060 [Devosia geojensis]|uniref:Uncharacterized protein n=1 Tax=Devosia geojensis TaxID=443610 RepID=A0A0F5FWZ1_9HYPH|nr:hypothetical protein [Devosia geojensis]KKB13416.1 hypothetical protein VE25_02060 [Devosia geojensis]
MRRLPLLVLVLLLTAFLGRPTVANALSDLVLTPLTTAIACEDRSVATERVQPCDAKAPIIVPYAKCCLGILPQPAPQLVAEAGAVPGFHVPWQPAFRIHHSQFRPPREA